MSSTKNWRSSLRRVNLYATHLLGTKATPVYVMTSIISFILAISITYGAYFIFYTFFAVILFALVLVIISTAARVIDDLNEGIASMILTAGLSRFEYILSWLISTVFYPVIIIALAALIPALVISPGALISYRVGPIGFVPPPLGMLIMTFSEQLYVNTMFALSFGIVYRRKSIAWVIAVMLTIIIPIISPMIGVAIALGMGPSSISYRYTNLVIYFMNFLFNPFYAYLSAYAFDPKDIVLPLLTIGISGVFGLIFTWALIYHAKHSMEA